MLGGRYYPMGVFTPVYPTIENKGVFFFLPLETREVKQKFLYVFVFIFDAHHFFMNHHLNSYIMFFFC